MCLPLEQLHQHVELNLQSMFYRNNSFFSSNCTHRSSSVDLVSFVFQKQIDWILDHIPEILVDYSKLKKSILRLFVFLERELVQLLCWKSTVSIRNLRFSNRRSSLPSLKRTKRTRINGSVDVFTDDNAINSRMKTTAERFYTWLYDLYW